MRILLASLALALAAGAFAQSAPRPLPPGTKPLDEPPPMLDEQPAAPAAKQPDYAVQPQVTTRKEGDQTVAEYRLHGKLYMMKVTPAHGHPYVLIDERGDGTFSRHDGLDPGLRVPQWVLLEF
jgi:hypothetical protein